MSAFPTGLSTETLHSNRELLRQSGCGAPIWLSLLILLVAGAMAPLMGWGYWKRSIAGPVVTVPARPTTDGVTKLSAERWRITCGPAAVLVTKFRSAGKYDSEFYFDRYEFLTTQQIETLSKVRRLVNDHRLAEFVGVSPQQMHELQEMRAQAGTHIEPADAARIAELFPVYEREEAPAREAEMELQRLGGSSRRPGGRSPGAPVASSAEIARAKQRWEPLEAARKSAQVPLIAAVEQAADHLFPTVQRSTVERAERARALLTEEQWQKMSKLSNR